MSKIQNCFNFVLLISFIIKSDFWGEIICNDWRKTLFVYCSTLFGVAVYGYSQMAIIYDKVSFFGQCSKMQLIPLQNFIIKTCFIQFLWFFRLKCWFKGQILSRIHLRLPNAYKLMCFDRNINGNRDGIFGHCTDQRNLL